MKDFGLDKGLVQKFDTSDKRYKGNKWGFRKMFWDYLKKLNVPFYDACCEEAGIPLSPVAFGEGPVYFNTSTGEWTAFPDDTSLETLTVNGTGTFDEVDTEYLGGNSTLSIISNPILSEGAGAAYNVTATADADDVVAGLLTSTSAAAVDLTLPTATDLAAAANGAGQGTNFTFFVDNSAGSNTVTVTVNTGITAITAVVTGSATLTVAAGAVGMFRIYFINGTTAKLSRVF